MPCVAAGLEGPSGRRTGHSLTRCGALDFLVPGERPTVGVAHTLGSWPWAHPSKAHGCANSACSGHSIYKPAPPRAGLILAMFWPGIKTSPAVRHLPATVRGGSAGLAQSLPARFPPGVLLPCLSEGCCHLEDWFQPGPAPTGTLSAWSVPGGEWHAGRLWSCRPCGPLHSPPLLTLPLGEGGTWYWVMKSLQGAKSEIELESFRFFNILCVLDFNRNLCLSVVCGQNT